MRFSATNTILFTALCASISISIFAGSLIPPAGAPVATMKTLDEVEPRIAVNAINTPGDVNALVGLPLPPAAIVFGRPRGGVFAR